MDAEGTTLWQTELYHWPSIARGAFCTIYTGIDHAPLKSRDWNKMAALDSEAAARVREDEHAGTPGEEARLTEGENEVVLSKLAEGIFGLLGPAVNEIDDRVADVR